MESHFRIAEASAKEVRGRIDIERIKAEERRASQKHEVERDAKQAQRDANRTRAREVADRKRVADEDAKARARNADLVAMQEESEAGSVWSDALRALAGTREARCPRGAGVTRFARSRATRFAWGGCSGCTKNKLC